jgi:thymidylate synthase
MIPTILIKSKDFHDAWYQMNSKILRDGFEIPSDQTEVKLTKDVCATIELTGEAIEQICRHELHPDNKMKEGLESYVKQFDYTSDEFKKSYDEQEYTYASRLYDSAVIIHEDKLIQKYNRGVQLTTWKPFRDLGNEAKPCLQRMWIRKLTDDTCELHMSYRSHDSMGAWQWNMIALVDYARRYLTKKLKIVKIVEFNDSLHLYEYDWESADNISKPNVNMRLTYV